MLPIPRVPSIQTGMLTLLANERRQMAYAHSYGWPRMWLVRLRVLPPDAGGVAGELARVEIRTGQQDQAANAVDFLFTSGPSVPFTSSTFSWAVEGEDVQVFATAGSSFAAKVQCLIIPDPSVMPLDVLPPGQNQAAFHSVVPGSLQTRVATNINDVTVVVSEGRRCTLTVHNNSTTNLFLRSGGSNVDLTAGAERWDVKLVPQAYWEAPRAIAPLAWKGKWDAADAAGEALISEGRF